MTTQYTHILVYYSEIGLKGRNRSVFEYQLIDNIKAGKASDQFRSVRRISGRILLRLKSECDKEKVVADLQQIFGIAYFIFVKKWIRILMSLHRKFLSSRRHLHFKLLLYVLNEIRKFFR